jgi:predicted dehydrogenase
VGVIHATFSFRREFDASGRHFNRALGGGGILDVGCYVMSMARLVAGAATGQPFAEPLEVTGAAELHPQTSTDLYAIASVRFSDGILAQLAAGVNLTQDSGLRVFGSEGWLHISNPFTMCREGGSSTLRLMRGEQVEEIVTTTDQHLFALEADAVGDALLRGETECAHMPVADSLGNMAALDAWRRAVGLTYAADEAQL